MRISVPASFPGSIRARQPPKVVSDCRAKRNGTLHIRTDMVMDETNEITQILRYAFSHFFCLRSRRNSNIDTPNSNSNSNLNRTRTESNRTTRHVCHETSWNHVRSHILLGFVRCDWLVRRPRHIHLYHFIYQHICDIIDYIETTTE